MDIISRYFNQIKAQLYGLTMSQRLLIGLLVVIMAGTTFFAIQFAAKPEMAELLPGLHPSPDEMAVITTYLKGKYEYKVEGDKVLVAMEKRYQALADLGAAQALPKDTTAAFTKLVESSLPLDTDANAERKWNVARQEVLTRVIRGFPYIADATVIISKGQAVGLGRPGLPSSATVSVKLKAGSEGMSGSQVIAIIDTVRGAVAGLKREDVHLTDGMRAYKAPNEDQMLPTDLLAFKRAREDEYVRKVQAILSPYGDVKVAVNVELDMSARTVSTKKYDPKGVVKAATEENSKETNSAEGAANGGEPGVMTNVATSAGGSGGGVRNQNSTIETVTKQDVRFSDSVETQVVPAATVVKEITASISVPRSYFTAMWRRVMKKEASVEPTDQELEGTIGGHLKRVETLAKGAMGTNADVRVDWFDDVMGIMGPGMGGGNVQMAGMGFPGGVNGTNWGVLLAQYGKQAVLGGIAIGALMMMLMMVRKAAPSVAGAEGDMEVFFGDGSGGSGGKRKRRKPGDPEQLDVDDGVIGEAGTGEAVLTGIELDDETLQSRKIVDEVSQMVKENPENAAQLVKKWMSKGK